VIEYDHSNGRCSLTGGYVYRGNQNTLANGSYIFGDYCSGEIFLAQNGSWNLLVDTTFLISSFGEDEAGELYVVNLNGAVFRLASNTPPACTYSINPTSANYGTAGGNGTVMVTAPAGCPWTAVSNDSWVVLTSGQSGSGNGMVTYSVAQYSLKRKFQNGTITIAGQTFALRQSR
jgi:hypothetical protein